MVGRWDYAALEYIETKIMQYVGDLGIEPRSQGLQHMSSTIWARQRICIHNEKQILYKKTMVSDIKQKNAPDIWTLLSYEDTHASSSSLYLQHEQVAGVLNPHKLQPVKITITPMGYIN